MEAQEKNSLRQKMQPTNAPFWNNLHRKVIASIPSVSKREIQFVMENKAKQIAVEPEKQVKERLYDIVTEAAELQYGIHDLSLSFKKGVIDMICVRFGVLTIQDVEFAYKRSEIEQNPYERVNLNKFIKPLNQWKNIKHVIVNAHSELRREAYQQQEVDAREAEFHNAAIEVYTSSLSAKQWTGDIFQASSLQKLLSDHFTVSEKETLTKRAQVIYEQKQEEQEKQREKRNTSKDMPMQIQAIDFFTTPIRIYAELLVESAIKKGIKIK